MDKISTLLKNEIICPSCHNKTGGLIQIVETEKTHDFIYLVISCSKCGCDTTLIDSETYLWK